MACVSNCARSAEALPLDRGSLFSTHSTYCNDAAMLAASTERRAAYIRYARFCSLQDDAYKQLPTVSYSFYDNLSAVSVIDALTQITVHVFR